jgi:hypothetical protein
MNIDRSRHLLQNGLGGQHPRTASKSRDHGRVVRGHSETDVFESGLVDVVGGWGGTSFSGITALPSPTSPTHRSPVPTGIDLTLCHLERGRRPAHGRLTQVPQRPSLALTRDTTLDTQQPDNAVLTAAQTLLANSSGTPWCLQDGSAPVRHDLCAVVCLLCLLVWPRNGVVMSMQPRPWPDVPALTARMARSSSRKGNLAMRIRDELGEVYADTRFAAAFGSGAGRGSPRVS